MASLKMTMCSELRPCMVNTTGSRTGWGTETPALFHGFFQEAYVVPPSPMRGGHQGGQNAHIVAVVEYDTGEVEKVEAYRIRFLDSPGNFKEYDWTDPAEQEEQEAEA